MTTRSPAAFANSASKRPLRAFSNVLLFHLSRGRLLQARVRAKTFHFSMAVVSGLLASSPTANMRALFDSEFPCLVNKQQK